jgi:hypothetical protein
MVLVTLGSASGAQADAAFEGSSPGNAETVAEPLTEIELRFSDPISLNETEMGETPGFWSRPSPSTKESTALSGKPRRPTDTRCEESFASVSVMSFWQSRP